MNKTISMMIEKASKALNNSHSPYSNFQVACCIQSDDGTLFTGVNVENASYPLTLCAEMSAIAQMVSSGYKRIHSLVIIAGNNELCSPCGACRQSIAEFATKDTAIYLCNNKEVLHKSTLEELLPLAFTFNPDLGPKHDK